MPQNQFPEINIDQLYKLLEEQKDEICKQHKDEICDRCRNEWFPDNTPGPCHKNHCQDAREIFFNRFLCD